MSASVKALTEDPYASLAQKYKVGEIYEGTVTKIMDYGCFLRLEDGVEGLIHNSELSWTNRNIQPSKVLSATQQIKVKIVSIDADAKRISLSYKETQENPWKKIQDQIGTVVKVKIKNITDKAIFAEMGDTGLTGSCIIEKYLLMINESDLYSFLGRMM